VPAPERKAPEGSLPKLTLAQRLLTALPDLQRRQRPAPSAKAAPDRTGPTSRNGSASTDQREVVRPDAVSTPAAPTVGGRLRDAFLKPAPAASRQRAGTARANPYVDLGVDELRRSMKYLDDRERQIAFFMGPLLCALDIAIMLVVLHSNPAHGKNHADPTTIVYLGIGTAVVALLVVVAAFFRRRSFTIFALLVAGYGGNLVTLLPAWLAAGWLFIHFNKMQRALTAKTGGPPGRQAANRRRQAAGRADGTARPRLGTKRAKAPEPAGPARNKRYTPPRPGT
jgi:hypothetical protein